MKYFFYPLLILSLFVSCKGNKNETNNRDSTQKAEPTDQKQNLIEKFKPIIQGIWVKKDYIEKIRLTKSPLAAMDVAGDIIIMNINTDSIKGNSLIIPDGNTHEGSQLILEFNQGKTPNALSFDGAELSYSFEKGDTILTFTRPDNENKKTIVTKYIRVLRKIPNNDLADGLNYIINKSVITGTYVLTDSIGNVSKVTFSNHGDVSGFLNYTKYEINFDLNSDPMDNLDEIIFDMRSKKHKSYSYKMNGDTLGFYNSYPNSDSTELILGKCVYKLIKAE
jgi:hypothetical protein